MSVPQSEMTSKSQESSNTEEQVNESGQKTAGTKPKGFQNYHYGPNTHYNYDQQFPTHHSAVELSSLVSNQYQDSNFNNQLYFLPQWDQNAGFHPYRSLNVSSTSMLNRDHNEWLTKTKICDHWRRSGNCSYGDSCWYAHGEDDLRKLNAQKPVRNDEKTNKEPEKSSTRRPQVSMTLPSPTVEDEMVKAMKPVEEPKEGLPPAKRASTNVKGLTVTIPPNIAFKEQVTNSSLPLSPAQERWVSMSCGASANEMAVSVEGDNDFEKKQTLEHTLDRRPPPGQFLRPEDIPAKQDDFGFMSPNPFPFNGRMPAQNQLHSHHRSFSRGPHQRNTNGTQQFTGMPLPNPPPIVQNQARIPHSGTPGFVSGFDEQRSFIPRSSSLIRSGREHTQMTHNGSQPQIQQACWNLAGDLFQRQKDMGTNGLRGALEQNQQPPMVSRKFEEIELNRLIAAQQQQKKQEMLMEFEASKMKDLAFLRSELERGTIRKHQIPRELLNELINNWNNVPLLNQLPVQQFPQTGLKSGGTDCNCGNSRPRHPSEHMSLQSHFVARQQALHQQQLAHQQQLRRFGIPTPITAELAAPPKIFESLLPSDDSFSIWLDPKPKREQSDFLREHPRLIPTETGVSLLAKMDALRSECCPISEEEMRMSHGPSRGKRADKISSSEDSSPMGMSLMELLNSENLLTNVANKPKTTMFDFDSLKISETLGMTPQSNTSASGKSESPVFFVGDEKATGYEDASPGLFTPLSANNPPFMDRCDFFAASGSCPFGDGCHLSHKTTDQQKQELRAL